MSCRLKLHLISTQLCDLGKQKTHLEPLARDIPKWPPPHEQTTEYRRFACIWESFSNKRPSKNACHDTKRPGRHETTQNKRGASAKTADSPYLAIQIWRAAVASAGAARKPLLSKIEMERRVPSPKRKRPKERSAPKAQKEQEKSKTHVKDPMSQDKHVCRRPTPRASP